MTKISPTFSPFLLRFAMGFGVFFTLMVSPLLGEKPSRAQSHPSCQLSPSEIQRKETLRQQALSGKKEDERAYFQVLTEHARFVGNCRQNSWPQVQAIWLRFYPCDIQNGEVERILDKIVNQGYNQVYIEAFYDGQVLLPMADNPTVWPSVLRTPGYEKSDLLKQAILKARQRGLRPYAWLFSLNFGDNYNRRGNRESALAKNGKGQTTTMASQDASLHENFGDQASQLFADPYNTQAREDYLVMVNAILSRYPNGMLFDYIRYLRGAGAASVITNVKDLWIYGEGAQQALFKKALNQKGLFLIQKYLEQGSIKPADITTMNQLYPQEIEPLWQEKNGSNRIQPTPEPSNKPVNNSTKPNNNPPPTSLRVESLNRQLWQLVFNHAKLGIVEFLDVISQPAKSRGLPVGAIFFPFGNQAVKEGGFDSRLQAWDLFSNSIQFHPMSYGGCGNMSCVLPQIERTIKLAPQGAEIVPALAGAWSKRVRNHLTLEEQMQTLQTSFPQLKGISHFAYAWQDTQEERQRQYCRLKPLQ